MKKVILFIVLTLALSSCVQKLEEEGVYDITTLKGRVINNKTSQAIGGAIIKITNGSITHSQTTSSVDGTFQLTVNASAINESFYMLITSNDLEAKGSLRGFGRLEYDYGNILVGNKLPTFVHNGITYNVSPDFGYSMPWSQGISTCSNLTYEGYSDWYLPSKEILNSMYIFRNQIGGFDEKIYWSCTEYSAGSGYAWGQVFDNTGSQYDYDKDTKLNVRCIRKAE